MRADTPKKAIFTVVIVVFVASLLVSVGTLINKPRDTAGDNIAGEVKAKRDLNNELLGESTTDTQNKLDQLLAAKKGSMEGVVRALDASIYMEGTHYLEAGGIVLSLLKSEKVNLSKYEDKNVKVYGTTKPSVEGDGVIMEVERVEAN